MLQGDMPFTSVHIANLGRFVKWDLSGGRHARTLGGHKGDSMTIALSVNGRSVSTSADPATPLIDVLRNHLDLRGTRYGCGLEQCGSCMVVIDGKADYACSREVGSVAGRSVTTVEGLTVGGKMHPLQIAFMEEQAGQCGYCLSGILMSAKALLDRNPDPTRADIVAALDGNLCRCGAHPRIMRAVEKAAAMIREGAVR